MKITPFTSTIGARVTEIDLRTGLEQISSRLRDALYEHLVLFIEAQPLSVEEQQRVAAIFGDTTPHPAAVFMKGKHIAGEVFNNEKLPPTEEKDFHNDYSFSDWVPAVGVLQALVVPSRGGDTIWADMYAAFETLSPSLQKYLATLAARHAQVPKVIDTMRQRHGAEVAEALEKEFSGRVHPMVVQHPVTGRQVLFVNHYITQIEGLHPKESDALLSFLRDHIRSPRFHCRYHWRANELAIWDEVATSHQGPSDFYPERRVLRRITVGLVKPGGTSALTAAA